MHTVAETPTFVRQAEKLFDPDEKQELITQMAPLMGMSLSGYRKWEWGKRNISGPAATLLRLIEKEPEAVKRALLP